MSTYETDDLDYEARMVIGFRMSRGCACGPYFMDRYPVLRPHVLAEAERRNEEPVDVFVEYAHKVHNRHECGFSLAVGRGAA